MIAEILPGLVMSLPDVKLVSERQKSIFIRAELIKKHIGDEIFVVNGQLAYAKITFTKPVKINLKKFKEMQARHKITEEQRKSIWPNKRTFYAYKIRMIQNFNPPIEVEYEAKTGKIFINKVKAEWAEPKPAKKEEKPAVQKEEVDIRLNEYEDSIVERRSNSLDNQSSESLEGRRLADYIPELDKEQVSKVINDRIDGTSFDESMPREIQPKERVTKAKGQLGQKINRLRRVVGKGNTVTIREPESVKKLKQENNSGNILDKFKKLLGN